jgi:hypothetical protein
MASLSTPLMVNVLHISRKCWRWALASSCAFPQNWLACTMLIKASLSSNPSSPTSIARPVLMLAVVGAENSRRVLLAMASNTGVKLLLGWSSSNEVVRDIYPELGSGFSDYFLWILNIVCRTKKTRHTLPCNKIFTNRRRHGKPV